MDAKLLKKLLTNNVVASAKKLFGENYHNWWFLHDNDNKFTSGLVKKWCFDNGIHYHTVFRFSTILTRFEPNRTFMGRFKKSG